MNFIMWLIVGIIVGRLASLLVGTREGLLLDIIAGIVGAFVAGLVLTPLVGISTINQNNFSLPAVLVSVGGAVMLLAVLTFFRRQGYRLR
ncbi:MAG TPA: GlsB/YeaQ/YmgE family stress response membrane protein [Anaerolineae bacterium]|nr:GlsB/YeaQ/YmgE family stress response membrane protein [Anaerolineae bacterium]